MHPLSSNVCAFFFAFTHSPSSLGIHDVVVERGKMSSNVFFFIDLAFVNGYS